LKKEPYQFQQEEITEHTFISNGPRGQIKKVVQFQPLQRKNIFNVGFGDLTPTGTIDDKTESNNDDIVKVLATVIHIIQNFLAANPNAKVFFTGSTVQRTEVYRLILKRHFKELSKTYRITTLKNDSYGISEVEFKPNDTSSFLGFLIEKNK
jgi:hypothetical protein